MNARVSYHPKKDFRRDENPAPANPSKDTADFNKQQSYGTLPTMEPTKQENVEPTKVDATSRSRARTDRYLIMTAIGPPSIIHPTIQDDEELYRFFYFRFFSELFGPKYYSVPFVIIPSRWCAKNFLAISHPQSITRNFIIIILVVFGKFVLWFPAITWRHSQNLVSVIAPKNNVATGVLQLGT